MNDLIQIETLVPAVVFGSTASIEDVVASLEKQVRAEKVDISTEEGRAACRSLARKVASSKTALDEMGKRLGDEWRAKTNALNADRRLAWDRLEALQKEVRAPLDAWEAKQKARVEAHQAELEHIGQLGNLPSDAGSRQIQERIDQLVAAPERDWEEFQARADEVIGAVSANLRAMLHSAVQREEERAELERLRAEKAAREQQERDERIAREAAEKARQEAEDRAARERAEAERKVQEADARARAEQERLEAERQAQAAAAKKAKHDAHIEALTNIGRLGLWANGVKPTVAMVDDRIAALAEMKGRERDWEEYTAQAASTFAAVAKRLDDERTAALARAEQARLAEVAAQEAERKRIVEEERRRRAEQEAAEAAAQAKREDNKRHRRKVFQTVVAALVQNALINEDTAASVFAAIDDGKIPHVRIDY